MNLPRRRFLHLVSGAAALSTLPHVARAQAYPSRPVRLLVGYPAGGVADLFARIIGRWLSERLGQSVIIENRPGAGSNVATEAVIHAPPDGYTLIYLTSSNSYNVALYDNANFDFIRDIVPVASVDQGIDVLVVTPPFPAKTLPEFIAYVKANPGKVNMASGGVGSSSHLYGELFKKMVGVDMLHVPYRGDAPAITDLFAGHVQALFATLATVIEHIKAGELRALAVTSAKRSDRLPDIPAIAEVVPGYDATGWQGIGAPRKTPAQVINKLRTEINAGLNDPAIKARIIDLGYSPFASSPAEFEKFIVEYTEKWAKVIRDAGIKAE